MGYPSAAEMETSASVACYIPIHNNKLLCSAAGFWQPLPQEIFASLSLTILSQHFVGKIDAGTCWVVEVDQLTDPEAIEDRLGGEYIWLGLRSQLGTINEDQFLLAGRALQIVQWHRDHRFCGRCGQPTRDHVDERAKLCSTCELHFYPRLSPCIITLVTRGNECLLARHARATHPVYTALAGFVEVGERPEDTVHREIREEVGVTVDNLRYVASQPWPFPGQLMLGFYADYAGGELCIDNKEIVEAGWYRYDQLPQVPPVATLSGQLIAQFVKWHSSSR